MKFKVTRTSDFFKYRKITTPPEGCTKENDYFIMQLNSLEGLMNFVNNHGEIIVLDRLENGLPVLEIYDDYRE